MSQEPVIVSNVEGHPNAVIIAEMLAQYYARADSMDKEERMKVLSIIGVAGCVVVNRSTENGVEGILRHGAGIPQEAKT